MALLTNTTVKGNLEVTGTLTAPLTNQNNTNVLVTMNPSSNVLGTSSRTLASIPTVSYNTTTGILNISVISSS